MQNYSVCSLMPTARLSPTDQWTANSCMLLFITAQGLIFLSIKSIIWRTFQGLLLHMMFLIQEIFARRKVRGPWKTLHCSKELLTNVNVSFFLCFVDSSSRYNRVKKHQLDAQLILSIFSQPLHVSDVSRPIIRRYFLMMGTKLVFIYTANVSGGQRSKYVMQWSSILITNYPPWFKFMFQSSARLCWYKLQIHLSLSQKDSEHPRAVCRPTNYFTPQLLYYIPVIQSYGDFVGVILLYQSQNYNRPSGLFPLDIRRIMDLKIYNAFPEGYER
jgi:hypothetical protein